VDKTLGQVKHQLMNTGLAQQSIRIFWDRGTIKYKGKLIAEITEDGQLTTYGEGDNVKEGVQALMAKWKAARDLQ